MRVAWQVVVMALIVGLSGCGDDDGGGGADAAELTSARAVAERIPGCAEALDEQPTDLLAPELVESAGACPYLGDRVVIEVYLDESGFDQALDRVAVVSVEGMAFVHGGRWSVRVPAGLAEGLHEAMGVDADVFTP